MRRFPLAPEGQDRRTVGDKSMFDSASEVWLIDVSGSMHGKRIELLKSAVKLYRQSSPHVRMITFSTEVREVASVEDIGEPNGGTNLHLAIERAAELMAGKCVIFSDGEPADKDACFAAASKVPGVVDAVFCGDSGDTEAAKFLDRLSRDNGGAFVKKDVLKGQALICGEVRDLLGLPSPIAL